MIIEKKTWPEAFQKVMDGKKKFDIRINDFDAREGDFLLLREWNPKTKVYTGREIKKKITYLSKTRDSPYWKIEDVNKFGFVVMSLE